jgi:DnaJ-class molecular chaperone
MADDTDAAAPPPRCSVCRGTGRVVSNLGGSPSTVTCPWCDGRGVFEREHDAQARWREGGSGAVGSPP